MREATRPTWRVRCFQTITKFTRHTAACSTNCTWFAKARARRAAHAFLLFFVHFHGLIGALIPCAHRAMRAMMLIDETDDAL
jgi:hypothetical protein